MPSSKIQSIQMTEYFKFLRNLKYMALYNIVYLVD